MAHPHPHNPPPPGDIAQPPARRGFLATLARLLFGSALALGLTSLAATNLLWLLGLGRFMVPNVVVEPPNKFRAGFPRDYQKGQVETRYTARFGAWIVRHEYEGQPQIYALKAVCTHLGCTPIWLDAEQKFKCPCHGSGFYKDGVHFEGPAPRPLERFAIRVADDGQIEVDKGRTFQQELGEWQDPDSYIPV
jgi:cytochrome b6-f complex iron-sulfur subunit